MGREHHFETPFYNKWLSIADIGDIMLSMVLFSELTRVDFTDGPSRVAYDIEGDLQYAKYEIVNTPSTIVGHYTANDVSEAMGNHMKCLLHSNSFVIFLSLVCSAAGTCCWCCIEARQRQYSMARRVEA